MNNKQESQCMCGFENGYHSKVCPFPLYRKDKPSITRVWQEEYKLNKRMEHKKGCPARDCFLKE